MRRVHHYRGIVRAALVAAGVVSSGLFGGSIATAQTPNINLVPELKSQTPEEKERDAQTDKAYRESLRKIPNQSVSDPWGSVRGADETAAKPTAPKASKATLLKRQTKTVGTTN